MTIFFLPRKQAARHPDARPQAVPPTAQKPIQPSTA